MKPTLNDVDMDIELSQDPSGGPALEVEAVRRAVAQALRRHQRRRAKLSIAVVDDCEIAELHQRFLGVPGPTDCLSFDLRDEPASTAIEGEIIVSWETAQREAAARNHPVQAELLLYVVHGLLHLLGFDDQRAEDAARIRAEESAILGELGLGDVFGSPRRGEDRPRSAPSGGNPVQ